MTIRRGLLPRSPARHSRIHPSYGKRFGEICPEKSTRVLELLQAAFQWRRGGPEQQGQSHYEKIVRLSHLPRSRTRPVSLTWQAARTGLYPRFLLMSQDSLVSHGVCGG